MNYLLDLLTFNQLNLSYSGEREEKMGVDEWEIKIFFFHNTIYIFFFSLFILLSLSLLFFVCDSHWLMNYCVKLSRDEDRLKVFFDKMRNHHIWSILFSISTISLPSSHLIYYLNLPSSHQPSSQLPSTISPTIYYLINHHLQK